MLQEFDGHAQVLLYHLINSGATAADDQALRAQGKDICTLSACLCLKQQSAVQSYGVDLQV